MMTGQENRGDAEEIYHQISVLPFVWHGNCVFVYDLNNFADHTASMDFDSFW